MPTSTFNVSRPPSGFSASRANDVRPHIDPMYKAQLIVKRDGNNVVNLSTPLPENYQFSLSTNYDNPFNQPLSGLGDKVTGGSSISALATGATALVGVTTLNKWLSGAVWTGGSLFQIDIPFVLQAYTDPELEIIKPMRELMQLVAPAETVGGMLLAPGPHLLRDPAGLAAASSSDEGLAASIQSDFESGRMGGDDITVKIGKFFTMRPCVITNVHESFDTQFDHNGNPISVVIQVSIMSFFTPTKEDIEKWFART